MKRKICFLLAVLMSFWLFGCGKNTSDLYTDPTIPVVETEPAETVVELKTFEEYFNENTNLGLKDRWLSIVQNETVRDIKEYDQDLYILTNKSLHKCGTSGTFYEQLQINVDGLTSIYDLSNYYIVFINDDGFYVAYGKTESSGEYLKCDFNVPVTNGLEYVAINKTDPNNIMMKTEQNNEFIYVIHDCLDMSGFTISVYGFDIADNEYIFKQLVSREKFELTNVNDKGLMCWYTSKKDKTKGIALFDNGDMHLFKFVFNKDTLNGECYIYDEFIGGIKHVFATRDNNYYFALKENDDSNIYLCRRVSIDKNDNYLIYETKIPLPENIAVKQIIGFIGRGFVNEKYYILLDGDKCLELDLNKKIIDTNQTLDEFMESNSKNHDLCIETDENGIVIRTYDPEFKTDSLFIGLKERIRSMVYINEYCDVFLLDDGQLYIAAETIK